MASPGQSRPEQLLEQLYLPLCLDENSLRGYFERATGNKVSLTLTDNSVSMVSARKRERRICLRLHRMFLGAGKEVLDELASFIGGRKAKTPFLRRFMRENASSVPEKKRGKRQVRPAGRYYHLDEIYDAVNADYFEGKISCLITWGTKNPRHSARKKTLGSYSAHTGTIRINPVLDRKTVPRYFVEFVVYHEMLHAALGVMVKDGRRSVHSREFRQRERLFRLYEQATAWEKGNLW